MNENESNWNELKVGDFVEIEYGRNYEYISKGKLYEVIEVEPARVPYDGATVGFDIVDDEGDVIYCINYGCGHLGGGSWKIAQEGQDD